jgi:hypothetical protein
MAEDGAGVSWRHHVEAGFDGPSRAACVRAVA